jgi:ribosomal 50S subunit-associated protein YjgA (DUF615 family)
MMEAEIKRVLECLDRLFEENESGETLLGRIEAILQEAIGKDEKVIREIVQNLPSSESELLRFHILDSSRDNFRALMGYLDIFRDQLETARTTLSTCVGDDD